MFLQGVSLEVPVLSGLLQHVKPVLSPSVSSAVDGGQTSGESPSAHQTDGQVKSLLKNHLCKTYEPRVSLAVRQNDIHRFPVKVGKT